MLCLNVLCTRTGNKVHLQHLHIANEELSCLKRQKCLGASLSIIWENIDGCTEHYRCATALYLLSISSQSYNIITDRGISAPRHDREVVYDLNDT